MMSEFSSLILEKKIYLVIFSRGFSTISLIIDNRTNRNYALKRITCHSTEDQIQAKKEIDYHKKFNHPNILPLIGSEIKGQADIVHNITSDAYLVLPYFPVGFYPCSIFVFFSRNIIIFFNKYCFYSKYCFIFKIRKVH